MELVFLPTYASWLNWIEAEFAALRYFALNGTDHPATPIRSRIGAYIRWRNRRAKPKDSFATDSKIRKPDYPSRPRDAALASACVIHTAGSRLRQIFTLMPPSGGGLSSRASHYRARPGSGGIGQCPRARRCAPREMSRCLL